MCVCLCDSVCLTITKIELNISLLVRLCFFVIVFCVSQWLFIPYNSLQFCCLLHFQLLSFFVAQSYWDRYIFVYWLSYFLCHFCWRYCQCHLLRIHLPTSFSVASSFLPPRVLQHLHSIAAYYGTFFYCACTFNQTQWIEWSVLVNHCANSSWRAKFL